ncbi:unnamed protein product [Paramecium sonneborni]|uniref:Transmembrane protein n=1 Tax=Paramecium sonneborni TaxID=65129 RepID=A0A8S1P0T3_9CILI|nr:unnamed protein product [Paramecium sonneborni]
MQQQFKIRIVFFFIRYQKYILQSLFLQFHNFLLSMQLYNLEFIVIRFFKVLSLNCVEYYHLYNNQFVIVIYLLQFSQILICQNGKLSQLYNNYELLIPSIILILHLDCQELCNLLPQHYFNQLLEASIIIILQMNKLSQIFFKICVLILFFVRVFCLNFIIDMIVDSFQQKMEAKS